MRLARTFWDQRKAQVIAAWLVDRSVEFELQPYPQENPVSWRLWILDQEKLPAVCQWVDEIESGKVLLEDISKDAILNPVEAPSSLVEEPAHTENKKTQTAKKQNRTSRNQGAWFTQMTIILLIVIHLALHGIVSTSVASYWKAALLMDNPSLLQEGGVSETSSAFTPPTTTWPGLYSVALRDMRDIQTDKAQRQPSPSPSWVFLSSVRQGQLWRLITPALLHADWIHLLFNVLWLSLLGTAIEPRLGHGKMALLIFLSAITSNFTQYLISGYNFLGFSGVVMALAAFVYVRIQKFPWEGYRIKLSTFTFIGFYLILTLCLQLLSFILDAFTIRSLSLNIANSAHFSGLIVGWLLGQMRSMAIRDEVL